MVQKIKAMAGTRRDGDLQIIARTDARSTLGYQVAMDRAHAFIAAGAHVAFVKVPTAARNWSAFRRPMAMKTLGGDLEGFQIDLGKALGKKLGAIEY